VRLPAPGQMQLDGRPLARRLAVAAVVAVIAAAACYLLLVRTSLGQRFDNAAYLGSQQSLPSTRATDTNQLRHITSDSFALVLLVLLAIGILRRRLLLGVAAAVAAGVAVVGCEALKRLILTRPLLTRSDAVAPSFNTFPSGHTAAAMACGLALMLVCAPRWRGVAAVVAGGYSWVTAAEVQTAGWHRPSDVIGAALLAFASVAGVGAVVAWARPVAMSWSRPHRIALAVLGVGAVASAIGAAWGAFDVVRWLKNHPGVFETSTYIRHEAYLTGVSATVFVVIGLVMTLLLLLGRVDLDHVGGQAR
jgi:membrane-associated phospholipid phosphatase